MMPVRPPLAWLILLLSVWRAKPQHAADKLYYSNKAFRADSEERLEDACSYLRLHIRGQPVAGAFNILGQCAAAEACKLAEVVRGGRIEDIWKRCEDRGAVQKQKAEALPCAKTSTKQTRLIVRKFQEAEAALELAKWLGHPLGTPSHHATLLSTIAPGLFCEREIRAITEPGQALREAIQKLEGKGQNDPLVAVGQLCKTTNLVVHLSKEEIEIGRLEATTLRRLYVLMRVCGVAAIDHAWQSKDAASFRRQVKKEIAAEIKIDELIGTKCRNPSQGQVHVKEDPQLPICIRTEHIGARDTSHTRFEVKMPMDIIPEELITSPPGLQLARLMLRADDIEVDTFSSVVAFPGSDHSGWHRDVDDLFKDQDDFHLTAAHGRPGFNLPPASVVLVAPLVDLTIQNGPTQFLPGSHLKHAFDWTRTREFLNGAKEESFGRAVQQLVTPPITLTAPAGAAILFDVRLLHRGTGNKSPDPREIVYMGYAQKWYKDAVNFGEKRSVGWQELRTATMQTLMKRIGHEEYVRTLERKLVSNS